MRDNMLAPAKINLYLHITGKRADGYHLLDSLMVLTDVADVITAEKAPDITLRVSGEFADNSGDISDNIVIKAARALADSAGVQAGASISLQKNIPVGAGLGGGSSDAAATLRLLNSLWGINYSDEKLAQIGLTLGADVPFCLYGKPAFVSGIGEVIDTVPDLPKFWILLVNPRKILSTKDVFTQSAINFISPVKRPESFKNTHDFINFLQKNDNNLQKNAINIVPEITDVLDVIGQQEGVLLSRMSGSGSTCFGLFESKLSKDKALNNISTTNPDWWVG
jgi:4-diphosphocytidyl-2-C-methyl-D-erythritol kinase